MNILERIEIIKEQLGIIDNTQDSVLESMFISYLAQALEICRRNEGEETETIFKIVQDITAAAWLQRGAEGMTSSNVGGQSYSFKELDEKLRIRLIKAQQRLARF